MYSYTRKIYQDIGYPIDNELIDSEDTIDLDNPEEVLKTLLKNDRKDFFEMRFKNFNKKIGEKFTFDVFFSKDKVNKKTLRNWKENKNTISKESAYKLCIANKLSFEETKIFFEKFCFLAPYNIKMIDELYYTWCIINTQPINEAETRINELKEIIENNTSESTTRTEDFLTHKIIHEISSIKEYDDLKQFTKDHFYYFITKKNIRITAKRVLNKLLEKLLTKKDIEYLNDNSKKQLEASEIKSAILKEMIVLKKCKTKFDIVCEYSGFKYGENLQRVRFINEDHSNNIKGEKDKKNKKDEEDEKNKKDEEDVKKEKNKKEELIEKKIINNKYKKINESKYRKIKSHLPNDDMLNVILCQDESTNKDIKDLDESLRKMIILLASYIIWIGRACKSEKNERKLEREEYEDSINLVLEEAGFTGLYVQNPYDRLFICCSILSEPYDIVRNNDCVPLDRYRGVVLELGQLISARKESEKEKCQDI